MKVISKNLFMFAVVLGLTMRLSSAEAAHQPMEKDKEGLVKIEQSLVSADGKVKQPYSKAPKPGINTMQIWPVVSADVGGTLLFSDSPEMVEQDGILYTDTVQGKSRILYYHLNATKLNKKIAVVLENMSSDETDVSVSRGGMGTPSDDYLSVGKQTQTEYFKAPKLDRIHIFANGKRLLDSKMNQLIVEPGQLVYGVFDFETKVPIKVSVVMLPAEDDPVQFLNRARVLPADSHRLRGTFVGMDRIVKSEQTYDSSKDGAVYIPLADDKKDEYRTGIDATDGSIVKNYGNYGILYKIHIPTKGMGKTKYYLMPRGGVYAGAMTVGRAMNSSKDMLLTPVDRTFFGEKINVNELAELGTYNDFASTWFEFSPPGASNLPVNLVLMPAE
ncbi:hypothetical protein [Propionispira raffinosivorans]|uniref:hypothetical protein n=1 Tax=Propionispira raffinosivorans TaxID=86959 RepID=UPI000382168B|nr:hypothetical protein [Propionispira raffinosivorans]